MLPAAQRHKVSESTGSVRRAFGQLPAYPSERSLYLDSETLDGAVLRCAGQHASVLTNPTGFRTSLPQGSPIGSGSIRWGYAWPTRSFGE